MKSDDWQLACDDAYVIAETAEDWERQYADFKPSGLDRDIDSLAREFEAELAPRPGAEAAAEWLKEYGEDVDKGEIGGDEALFEDAWTSEFAV